MKRGTPNHPKTHTLAAILNVPLFAAVGVLESLWHFAQAYAQDGNVGRHTDEAIARAIGWTDNGATLVSGLVQAGWLDRCSCHRVRIHDWPEHADQTVKRWLTTNNQRFLACYDDPSSVLGKSYPAVPCRAVPSLTEPVAQAVEPPPTPATPAEARDAALHVLGPPPDINPLVTGRRRELELECLRLTDEIAKASGEYPEHVLGKASGYKGSTKLNPAGMRDTRLLHTVEALRARHASLRAPPEDEASHLTEAQKRAGLG